MMDAMQAITQAANPQAVADALVAASAAHDVVYASHRILQADGRATGVTTMPQAWIDHYTSSGYDQMDPGAGRATAFLGVGGDSFEAPPSGETWSPKMRQMNAEIRQLHAHGSFFLSQATPRPGVTSMVNFITDASGLQYGQWVISHGGQLRLLAAGAHVRLMELFDLAPPKSQLTPRERDALRWLADGNRVDRIAQKMGLSNRTVEVHLANARARLGAKTREQALVLALRAGLFDPLD